MEEYRQKVNKINNYMIYNNIRNKNAKSEVFKVYSSGERWRNPKIIIERYIYSFYHGMKADKVIQKNGNKLDVSRNNLITMDGHW